MRRQECTWEALLERTAPYMLQLLFVAYPIVSRVAFDGFSCYTFSKDDTKVHEAFLKADVSIECDTPKHHEVEILASVAIAVYPVGLLVLVAGLLFSARRDIIRNTPSRLSLSIAFLHREYKPHFFWWELVEMLRRFVLVGLMVLYQDTMMQLIVGSLLSAIFLLLQVQASPYKEQHDNFLAASISFFLLVYFMFCTSFKYTALTNLEDIQSKMSEEQQKLYVLSVSRLSVIGMTSIVGALVCSIAIFAAQLSAEVARHRTKLLDAEELAIVDVELRQYRVHAPYVHVEKSKEALNKFMTKTLVTGQPEDAARGLPYYMGVPDPFGLARDGIQLIQMEVAHFVASVRTMTDDDADRLATLKGIAKIRPTALAADLTKQVAHDLEEWLEYILFQETREKPYSNGVRDEGRGSVLVSHFFKHEKAVEANLEPAHVVALRFYTTHAFKYLNGPLRSDKFGHEKYPHPLPITLTYISEGIKRLRAVQSDQMNSK
ncbi:MAG: hypothetical protein SGPRY_009256, partial [Prymnesium sp.]